MKRETDDIGSGVALVERDRCCSAMRWCMVDGCADAQGDFDRTDLDWFSLGKSTGRVFGTQFAAGKFDCLLHGSVVRFNRRVVRNGDPMESRSASYSKLSLSILVAVLLREVLAQFFFFLFLLVIFKRE